MCKRYTHLSIVILICFLILPSRVDAETKKLGDNEPDDQFGSSIVTGDFNGDGRDDLAVGAPGEAPGADPKSGYVFTFQGSTAALTAWIGLQQTQVRMVYKIYLPLVQWK